MQLTAYALTEDVMEIVPMSHQRDWMDATPNGFAYRCLPLTIANQGGWAVLCPCDVAITWDGRDYLGGIEVKVADADSRWLAYIRDHFGAGILTFSIPYLFRTPPGYGLLVRGPANRWTAGVSPLEGLVETDWSVSTFTMNWRILEADRVVRFKKGDPICVLTPFAMESLEAFEPEMKRITDDQELFAHYTAWSQSRARFNEDPERKPQDWQKDYFLGKAPDGVSVREHRTRLNLKPFPPPPSWSYAEAPSGSPEANQQASGGLPLVSDAAGHQEGRQGLQPAEGIPTGCPYHAALAAEADAEAGPSA